jgi:hypothetical protein
MERTISRFVPLIRFHDNIDSKEFFDRIIPYEDLLSKKLRHEILRYHLFSHTKQIGSYLLHVNLIQNLLIKSILHYFQVG